MASFQQGGDPISVNAMFLDYYLDVMREMMGTYKEQNSGTFQLYVMHLRASVIGKQRKANIDKAMQQMDKDVSAGLFGSLTDTQKEFMRGFCAIEACTEFLNDAFKISMSDAAAMADMTDDDLLMELEHHIMFTRIRQAYAEDKPRMKALEARILSGEIGNLEMLTQVLAAPAEELPQGDKETIADEGGAEVIS